MADTFEQLRQNLKSKNVQSAIVAVDYLENDMLKHMEALLSDPETGLKQWKTRGFRPLFENPTRILVERSAKTYKEPPKRNVTLNGALSQTLTDSYKELLSTTNLNFTAQDVDHRSRLLDAALLLPQVADDEDETITLSVLSRDNCEVLLDPDTRKMTALLYTAGNTGIDGGQMFHGWTADEIVDMEDGKVVGRRDNPYGIIPAAILHDTRPSLGDLWSYPRWEQLIAMSDGVNFFNTEALFNARYGMVGSPVTNMEIPEGTVMGIDAPKSFNSMGIESPFFNYEAPTTNIEAFHNWLGKFKETISDEWGVNLKFAGGSIADSGFKLVVEEFENIELRQTRIVAARQFEEDLYQVFATMSAVHDWGLDTNGRGVADFKEPKLPVNEQTDWLIAKEQLTLGMLSPKEYWLKRDPDITPEQLAEKQSVFDASRGLAGNVPAFEDDGAN